MPTRRATVSEPNEDTFRGWVLRLWRERYVRIAASGTAVNLMIAALKYVALGRLPWLATWSMTIHHALQAIVILVLLLVLYPDRFARPRDLHRQPYRALHRTQNLFYEYWRLLWFTWFLLYMVLAGFSFAIHSKLESEINSAEDRRTAFIVYLSEQQGLEPREISNDPGFDRQRVDHLVARYRGERPELAAFTAFLLRPLWRWSGSAVPVEFDVGAGTDAVRAPPRLDEMAIRHGIARLEDMASDRSRELDKPAPGCPLDEEDIIGHNLRLEEFLR